MKKELKPHQVIARDFLYSHAFAINSDSPGLGKTAETLAAVEKLYLEKKIQTALVIVPCNMKLKNQWPQDIENFTNLSYTIIKGDKKQRKTLWEENTVLKLVNYELVQQDWEYIQKGFDIVILDEAHRIRSCSSKIGRKIKLIPRKIRWALTATPLYNNAEDIFSIAEFLHPFFLGNYWSFRNTYMIIEKESLLVWRNGKKIKISFNKIVGYKNLDKLSIILSPIMLRRDFDDAGIELPEKIVRDYNIELSAEQKIVYNNIKKEMIEKIKRNESVLGEIIHLRFACDGLNGGVKIPNSYKLDELLKIIKDNPNRKIIVFTNWVQTLLLMKSEIESKTNILCSNIYGELNAKERQEEIDKFENNDKYQILLSSPSAEEGLNLQSKCSMMINYDLPWNHSRLLQRIGRIHRIGQTNKVLVYNFITKDTIEERVNELILQKKNLSETILDKNPKLLEQVI